MKVIAIRNNHKQDKKDGDKSSVIVTNLFHIVTNFHYLSHIVTFFFFKIMFISHYVTLVTLWQLWCWSHNFDHTAEICKIVLSLIEDRKKYLSPLQPSHQEKMCVKAVTGLPGPVKKIKISSFQKGNLLKIKRSQKGQIIFKTC